MKKHIHWAIMIIGLYFGLHNGYLTLYDSEKAEIVEVFPYRAAVYPKADQTALSDGIPISSQEALEQFLADYMS